MKFYINVAACFLFGIGIVGTLILVFGSRRESTPGGFQRRFGAIKILTPQYERDLQYNSYYIAGADTTNIYLANSTDPNHLAIADSTLKIQHATLNIPDTFRIAWKMLRVQIDHPRVFVSEGVTPTILSGSFPELRYTKIPFNLYFTELVPVDQDRFCFRAYNQGLAQNILLKAHADAESHPVLTYTLEKQYDGLFCTDGMLLFNAKTSETIYVYYYRNQFVRLDSMMQVRYRAQTIDTMSNQRIEAGIINSDRKMVLLNDPIVVNKHSCVDEDFLYVQSGVKADNETDGEFKSNSVIDVYALTDNAYRFSFYLPNVDGNQVDDFKVVDGRIIAINSRILRVYKLPDDPISGNFLKRIVYE